MKIALRTRTNVADLIIESENTRITEDIAFGSPSKIEESTIEDFISVAFEMSRYNQVDDVNFVKTIYDNFLSDSERNRFLELINQK